MTASKRELKEEKSIGYHASLTADAFKRPVEVKEVVSDRADFLKKLYGGKAPEYDNKPLYHEQIQILANLLEKLTREYKEISLEDVSKITAFPNYLKELIATNPHTIPYANIKETFEKIVYRLQMKIKVDKDQIRQQFKENKVELSDDELQVQFQVEQKTAEEYEARKPVCLVNLLPRLLVCDTGMAGHLDFALEYLTGGDSLEDVLCQLRTKYVTDFGYHHLRMHKGRIAAGNEIHVPVILRNRALGNQWGISSEMENVKEHFVTATLITPETLDIFEAKFSDVYQLRSMAEAAAKKFEQLFFQNYRSTEHKGESKYQANAEEKHRDWFKYGKASFFFRAEDILKKWNMVLFDKEENVDKVVSGTKVFELKDDETLRFSPLHFKQFFWQYCRDRGCYAKPDSWTEEKIFNDFHLFHSKTPGLADCAWIEDEYGNIFSFEKLPEAEKQRYFLYSTVQFGFADQFHWLTPSPSVLDVFKEQKQFEELAQALKADNKWDRHKGLLVSIFKEAPHHFFEMLEVMDENTRLKCLDIVGITYHWLHPTSDLHDKIIKLIPEGSWLEAQFKIQKSAFDKFHSENKLDAKEIPIRYSRLIELAKTSKAEDEWIFKMYLERYFPKFYRYRVVAKQSIPGFARGLVEADNDALIDLQNAFRDKAEAVQRRNLQIRMAARDGDLNALEEMKVSVKEINKYIHLLHDCGHRHLLKHFYEQERVALFDQGSTYQAPFLFWLLSFDQEDKEVEKLLAAGKLNVSKIVNSEMLDEAMLHRAVRLNLITWIRKLLNSRADVNVLSLFLATPLNIAAQLGSLEIVRLLLEKNADVNLARQDGVTPLLSAVTKGHLEVIQLLLDKGAWVNAAAANNKTPLLIAAKMGRLDIVKLLLSYGANPTLRFENLAYHQHATDPYTRQLLVAAEGKFKKAELQEEKISAHYRLFYTKESGNQGWLEDKNGEVVVFDKLSAAEKMEYFINSTVRTGFPDQFHLTHPEPTLFQVFSKPKDWADLTLALIKDNQWEKHKGLLKFILHERPAYFVRMLEAVHEEKLRSQLIDLMDLNYSLLHPQDRLHEAIRTLPMQTDDEKLGLWLAKKLQQPKDLFAKFQHEHKLESKQIPIPYPVLLKIAPKAKPSDQFIFKLYLQHYFSVKFRNVASQENFSQVFLEIHKKTLDSVVDNEKAFRVCALDGDLKSLQKIFDAEKIYDHIEWMLKSQSKQLLDFCYQRFVKMYSENRSIYGASLLYLMVLCNQSENESKEVQALLAVNDLDVNAVCHDGDAPLHVAAARGLTNWVKTLCEFKSINIDLQNKKGETPLRFAACNGYYDVVRLLLEKGAKMELAPSNMKSPLSGAIEFGHLDIVQLLIERGANIHAVSETGISSSLMLAVRVGHLDIVQLLIERGANIHAVSENGNSLLMHAVWVGHLNVVHLLIEKGAKVDVVNRDGADALHYAAHHGNEAIVKLLLNHGANPTTLFLNKTPYQHASNPQVKSLLLAAEIKFAIKKLASSESKESKPTFFANKNVDLIQHLTLLQGFLEGNLSKAEFKNLKSKFNSSFKSEPWKSFYKEAVSLSSALSDHPTLRAERKR